MKVSLRFFFKNLFFYLFQFCFKHALGEEIEEKRYTREDDKPENDQEKSTSNEEVWKTLKKEGLISFDEIVDNFLDVLKLDLQDEFPFVLFILVNRGEVDFEFFKKIERGINLQVSNLINKKNSTNSNRVMVVIVPIDNQTPWHEHFLSNYINLPVGYPAFILTCRQKKCTKCKSQGLFSIISIFIGVFEPMEVWLKDFLNKNQMGKSLPKEPMPYPINQVGIIQGILVHNFKK